MPNVNQGLLKFKSRHISVFLLVFNNKKSEPGQKRASSTLPSLCWFLVLQDSNPDLLFHSCLCLVINQQYLYILFWSIPVLIAGSGLARPIVPSAQSSSITPSLRLATPCLRPSEELSSAPPPSGPLATPKSKLARPAFTLPSPQVRRNPRTTEHLQVQRFNFGSVQLKISVQRRIRRIRRIKSRLDGSVLDPDPNWICI